MFGIGGGELIFILFIVLMLFGSDKVPEIARTMGKAMAQLKNATNDIKNEIQKGAEDNGFDQKMLDGLTNNITKEINSAKANLLGDANPLKGISETITNEINTTKSSIVEGAAPQIDKVAGEIESIIQGPIKRTK
jgi:sec-independent protein translocase protein TatA